jgi:hypothetical protein
VADESVTEQRVTYWAITGGGKTVDDPHGIVRRREMSNGGILDEALGRDLDWHRTGVIAEWKRASFADELEQVSDEKAQEIITALKAGGPY